MLQTADREQFVKIDRRAVTQAITISIAGRPLNEIAPVGLRPPLVSFVLICWNYAQYVAETIASIRAQDYPQFECLVIDNGSTDRSGDEIVRAIEQDERFKVVTFNENLGQLGAALWALDQIKGSFVTFVDADDILFSNFASTHVQVHLALPRSVALTSSNVLEMNADGGIITSQYDKFGLCVGDRYCFRDAHILPRLSTVSEDHFDILNERTLVRQASESGWCWAPGSANMFRRTVLNFCRIADGQTKRMRAADNHFNHLSHAIGGTALIDFPSSAYRHHQANYFSTSETLPDLRRGTRAYVAQATSNRAETVECVLRNSTDFNWLLPRRYWSLIDQLGQMGMAVPPFANDPHIIAAFTRHITQICAEFGYKATFKEITKRFGTATARSIFKQGLSSSEYGRVRKYVRRAKIKKFFSLKVKE